MRLLLILLLLAMQTFAAKPSHSKSAARSSTKRCQSCARDKSGRIQRSSTAKHEFQREHACPSTGKTSGACPGYVIDHKQALKHGGKDSSANMHWQTTADAKAKDRVED